MNEIGLVNELVGGPLDGSIWSSDWVPHWCQRISYVARGPFGSHRWADYELQTSRLEWKDAQACAHFRYLFVGFRETFPSRSAWLLSKLIHGSRWLRVRCLGTQFSSSQKTRSPQKDAANP